MIRILSRKEAAQNQGRFSVSVFYNKLYHRLLVPLTAANQPQAPPELRAALSTIDKQVNAYTAKARLR